MSKNLGTQTRVTNILCAVLILLTSGELVYPYVAMKMYLCKRESFEYNVITRKSRMFIRTPIFLRVKTNYWYAFYQSETTFIPEMHCCIVSCACALSWMPQP